MTSTNIPLIIVSHMAKSQGYCVEQYITYIIRIWQGHVILLWGNGKMRPELLFNMLSLGLGYFFFSWFLF